VPLDASKKQTSVGWPQFLPDGKHFIYMVTGEKQEDTAYWIGSIDSADKKNAGAAQTLVQYAPPGYLLFVRDRTLVAQALRRLVAQDHRRGRAARGEDRHRQRGPRPLLGLEGRRARLRTGETGGRLLWRDRAGRELDAWRSGRLREPHSLRRAGTGSLST
jgi:hypothetical protein